MQLRVTPAEGDPFTFDMGNGSIVVGRSSTADLSLADPFASRHHARLTRRGESLQVEDLGARNGTFLDDRPVVGPMDVGPGGLITIAGSTIRRMDAGAPISEVTIRTAAGTSAAADSSIARSVAEILGESSDSIGIDATGAALRCYVQRLETLRGIHRAFSRAATRAELLSTMLDWAFDLFSPQQGDIYLRASDGQLRKAASRPSNAVADIPLPEELVTRVLRERLAVTTRIDGSGGGSAAASAAFLIAAPMLDGDSSFGLLVLSRQRPGRPFGEEQLDLFGELVGEGALELRKFALAEEAEQRRLFEHELALAGGIQRGILPDELPSFEGYSFFGRNIPSRVVSGDFFRATLRGGGEECVLITGDVSGKGFSAALLTVSVEALSAVMIEAGDPPHVICSKLSSQLFDRTSRNRFVTAFAATLDRRSGRLAYTNAGDNAALLARADGSVEKLPSLGLPLAVKRDSVYPSREVVLEPGATLLLYTDGVTEAANHEEQEYGLARLEACFVRHRQAPLTEIFEAIQTELDDFVGDLPYADDRTILMVRRAWRHSPT
jgi:serine phosphatase RsbU (regulator of sigma subunit)